jgi:hypothetical protein
MVVCGKPLHPTHASLFSDAKGLNDMLTAQTVSVSINKPFDEVYEFAHQPANFALWADGMGEDLRAGMGGIWLAETSNGPAEIQFTPRNDHGVLDHTLRLSTGRIYVPLRVVKNGDGCEVMLTVFRLEQMSDAAFNSDLDAVTRDLNKLKSLLEDGDDSVVRVDFTRGK